MGSSGLRGVAGVTARYTVQGAEISQGAIRGSHDVRRILTHYR